jgi:hypothetical protein
MPKRFQRGEKIWMSGPESLLDVILRQPQSEQKSTNLPTMKGRKRRTRKTRRKRRKKTLTQR